MFPASFFVDAAGERFAIDGKSAATAGRRFRGVFGVTPFVASIVCHTIKATNATSAAGNAPR